MSRGTGSAPAVVTDGAVARLLRVEHISQRFGDRIVLDDVSLEVPAGRVIGLLGPNGAGKTTLMRILFGVLVPDAGRVSWCGRPATDADRRGWGYMPQERGLYRDMRVADHLVWIGRLHGMSTTSATRRVGELLERLGLADRARDTVKSLSGGMAQRVQLATAVVHEPHVLVLDEPFSGLDPAAVAFLSGVIADQVARGANLVLSSHQLDLVEDICESIVLVHRGQVVLRGEVTALKAASPDRYLRVDVAAEPAWFDGLDVAVERNVADSRIRLGLGTDPLLVLDRVRAHAHPGEFAVDRPTLSELFIAATGAAPDTLDVLDPPAVPPPTDPAPR